MSNTTEVPTFFGPQSNPLFGVLHLPDDNRIRGAVLVCASLGKEGMDSIRFQRILADELAQSGYAVLRFDYLGTGNSSFSRLRDSAVEEWTASVQHAHAYLTEIGVPSVSAVAIRAGALILHNAIASGTPIDRAVYLDPPATGRRYLREQSALFKISVGSDAVQDGIVSTIGGLLSSAAAQKFSTLKLSPEAMTELDQLLVLRPGAQNAFAGIPVESDRIHLSTVRGLPEFAQTSDIVVPMPLEALDQIVAWLGQHLGRSPVQVRPHYQKSAPIPADTGAVLESIEMIGAEKMFAIRSRPIGSRPGAGRVVLFFVTANDPHVGPAREWVELSRQIAENGLQAVRWDRSGRGQSPPIDRSQWLPIFSHAQIEDGLAAARFAADDPQHLTVVGICSGAWYAAHAARAYGVESAILINNGNWNWHSLGRLAWQWNVRSNILAAATTPAADVDAPEIRIERPSIRTRVIEYLKPKRDVAKVLLRKLMPRTVKRGLGRAGVAQVPELILAPLARNGTKTVIMLSPMDDRLFTDHGGYAAVEHLQRAGMAIDTIRYPGGDHAAYHQAALEAIRHQVLTVAVGADTPSTST